MCDRLSQIATASNVTALNTYRDWKNKLITLDNERLANVAEIARITGCGSTNTSSSSRSGFSSSSRNTPSTTNNNVCDCNHPPPLTDRERDLLYKHYGCYKCWSFYAGHRGKDCSNTLPKAAGYCKLTEDDALRAKKKHDCKKLTTNSVPKHTTAVIGYNESVADNITAVVGGESPLANGVLGYGSGFEDSECVTPFSISHFTIRGFIHDSTDPRYDIPVRMLIDCGSSTVLMRSEITTALGLRRCRLPASSKLDSVWGSEGTIVTEYVQLRFSLRLFAWTSRFVHCLLVDELCAPIILSMPFLSHNDLIISFSSRKCVDSRTGFNLLNPSYKHACSPVVPSLTHAKRHFL
jgi:hypothetical protein